MDCLIVVALFLQCGVQRQQFIANSFGFQPKIPFGALIFHYPKIVSCAIASAGILHIGIYFETDVS